MRLMCLLSFLFTFVTQARAQSPIPRGPSANPAPPSAASGRPYRVGPISLVIPYAFEDPTDAQFVLGEWSQLLVERVSPTSGSPIEILDYARAHFLGFFEAVEGPRRNTTMIGGRSVTWDRWVALWPLASLPSEAPVHISLATLRCGDSGLIAFFTSAREGIATHDAVFASVLESLRCDSGGMSSVRSGWALHQFGVFELALPASWTPPTTRLEAGEEGFLDVSYGRDLAMPIGRVAPDDFPDTERPTSVSDVYFEAIAGPGIARAWAGRCMLARQRYWKEDGIERTVFFRASFVLDDGTEVMITSGADATDAEEARARWEQVLASIRVRSPR